MLPFQTTEGICASASLSVKYQCPLGYFLKPETSPRTQSFGKAPSSTSFAALVRAWTDSASAEVAPA